MTNLQEKFVLVPIDKAANNIGFICKKYFLETLQEETRTPTYEEFNFSEEATVQHIVAECREVGIEVPIDSRKIPQIHATIKMHKQPVKFRFIIGDRQSSMKQLAKKLVKVLQLVLKTLKRYCEKVKYYTGIQRYWIIESNLEVLEDIMTVNSKQNAKSIKTFDFSTLYTTIPLEDLKEKLKGAVEKAFKGGQNQFIQIRNNDSKWYHKKNTDSISKQEIFQMIDIIIDNSFFKLGNMIFRQRIGIPMGIDPAPQMANLYLHAYESKFMEELTKTNYTAARKFNKTRRFIDDLHTINNEGELEKYHHEGKIYPKEMQLNPENEDEKAATFLDLDEKITEGKIIVKTYDKREAFNFQIINYPDLSGNIPKKPAYGVFTSQIIRNARICSRPEDLTKRIQLISRKLLKKKFTLEGLKCAARECFKKHPWILNKISTRPYRRMLEIPLQ